MGGIQECCARLDCSSTDDSCSEGKKSHREDTGHLDCEICLNPRSTPRDSPRCPHHESTSPEAPHRDRGYKPCLCAACGLTYSRKPARRPMRLNFEIVAVGFW